MPIKKYTSNDIPRLLELIRAVYDQAIYNKAVQRFKWQYEENPNNTANGPIIWILEEQDKIIGMIGCFAQKLKVGNSIFPAYWVGDLMVHPEHRSALHGSKLALKTQQQPLLLMGFPADNTLKMWSHAGAKPFVQLVQYSQTIKQLINTSRNKLKSVINTLKEALDKFGGDLEQKKQGIKMIDILHFDARFDRLWEKASKGYPALQVRDSQFLNWRFCQCPHLTYRILAAEKDEEILGYIVLRDDILHQKHQGHIIDLFSDRTHKATAKLLIQSATRFFKNIQCDEINMVISADDQFLNDVLKEMNFSHFEKREQGIYSYHEPEPAQTYIQNSSNWFLTKTDSDMDFA